LNIIGTCGESLYFPENEEVAMSNLEILSLIEKLGQLFTDYRNCKDPKTKEEIYRDIQLIGKAIDV